MANSLTVWWDDRSLLGKGIVVVALPLAALIGITTSFLFASVAADREARQFERASEVAVALDAVLNDVLLAETSVYAYVLTQDASLLEPYRRVEQTLPGDRGQLLRLLAGEPEHALEATQIESLLDLRMRQLADLLPRDSLVLSRFQVAAGAGTTDEIRSVAASIQRTEDADVRAAETNRHHATTRAKAAAWLGIVVGVLGGVLGSVVFARSISRRVRRNRENAELLVAGQELLEAPHGHDGVGRSGAALVEAARQIREAQRDLERSNQELERFAYVASHDLQEPLRMVAGHVQLLASDLEGRLEPEQKESMAFAVDGAKRMQRLINDLLTYSRVGRRGRSPEPTPLGSVLETALLNLQVAIDEQGATVTSDDLPVVNVDAGQMVQLLQNLVGNAIKFRRDEPPRVHLSAESGQGKWTVTVEDNGIGIEPENAERVFQIFQRLHTRAEYEGTGIGLAVCRRIVERHGGHIWIESASSGGSRVRFTIPSATADLAA